jgi:hypothetical protein
MPQIPGHKNGNRAGEVSAQRNFSVMGMDYIDPSFAADNLVIAVALHKAFKRVADFHCSTYLEAVGLPDERDGAS